MRITIGAGSRPVVILTFVSIQLRPVTLANRGDIDDIEPGQKARTWVHAGWYWHQASLDRPGIEFRLVHQDGVEVAVGMVGYGRAYADEDLTEEMPGRYELAHLVIDYRHQRQGIGQQVARSVLTGLAAQPDCRELMVAHHPDNEPSRQLFVNLGFAPTDECNYDGDPVLLAKSGNFLEPQIRAAR